MVGEEKKKEDLDRFNLWKSFLLNSSLISIKYADNDLQIRYSSMLGTGQKYSCGSGC